MASLHDGYLATLRSTNYDSEKGSDRKVVELLARMGQPNGFGTVSQATSTFGKQWVRLASSLGFRIKSDNTSGQSLTFRRYAANQDSVGATLTTALAGANNDLVFTSVPRGLAGNDTTIEYIDPPGNNVALSVAVTGQAISVTCATDGASAITSTAAQIKAAIEATPAAVALVTIALAAANDGTGVVTALAPANLAGGTDATVPTIVVASGVSIDLPCIANANEWEVRRTDSNAASVTLLALVHKMV